MWRCFGGFRWLMVLEGDGFERGGLWKRRVLEGEGFGR